MKLTVLRTPLALAFAAATSACQLFDWFAPKDTPDPAWDPIGRVQQTAYVKLPTSDPYELKADPIWTPHGVIMPGVKGTIVAFDPTTGGFNWTTILNAGIAGARPAYRDGRIVLATNHGMVALSGTLGTLLWQAETPADERATGYNTTPADRAYTAKAILGLDAGAAYLPMWGSMVSQLDMASGMPAWVWRDTADIANPAGTTGVAVSGDTVYTHAFTMQQRVFTNSNLWVVALRRGDGHELWRRKLPEAGEGAGPYTAPLIHGNLLIVRQLKRVVALDRFTNQIVWEFRDGDRWLDYWSDFALDGGRLYVAVASESGTDDAIVALDAATGALVWKTIVYGAPDKDLVVSPTRVYAINSAYVTVLDRATGKLLVRTYAPNRNSCGPSSSAAVGGGQVFLRVGCTGGSKQSGFVYTDFLWGFAEP